MKKKLNDHNQDKYITTLEFNTLAEDVFNARLAQANLITKTHFDAKLLLNCLEKLRQTNLKIYLLKMN